MVKLDDPKVRAVLEDGENSLPRMSFGDHLDELRKRLIRALLALVIAVVGVMSFKHEVQEIVVEPYRVQWHIGFDNWIEKLEQRRAAGDLVKDDLGRGFLVFTKGHYDSIVNGTFEDVHLLPEETGYHAPYALTAIDGLESVFHWMFGSIRHEVQALVVEAYRVQWRLGFDDWIETLAQRDASGELAKDDPGQRFLVFTRGHYDSIVDGTFEHVHLLPTLTGYNVPYTLMAINGLEDIFNWMFASIVFAIVLASPYVVWQAWAFIAAGLYTRERSLFYKYFPFMVGLFAAGVLFGYLLVLPFSLGFLINLMDPSQVGSMLSIGQYFALLFALTAALGLVFQLPLVMVALQRVGLVTHAAFKKHWRITILIIAACAALFTPPEPVSMVLTMTPMCGLYGIGLLLTSMGEKKEAGYAVEVES